MPPRSEVPLRKRTVLLTEPNEHEYQKRYRDPTNKRSGTKYGEFNGLVNELLAKFFRENPVISNEEFEANSRRLKAQESNHD